MLRQLSYAIKIHARRDPNIVGLAFMHRKVQWVYFVFFKIYFACLELVQTTYNGPVTLTMSQFAQLTRLDLIGD